MILTDIVSYFCYFCHIEREVMINKWIRRKRNSLGYGVQSPNDFFFVQHVLREKTPYYGYDQLHKLMQFPACLPHCPEAVCRLLFRLANHIHPQTIVEIGTGAGFSACAMSMGSTASECITIDGKVDQELLEKRNILLANYPQITAINGDELELFNHILQSKGRVELLHIAHTTYYKEAVDLALPYIGDSALFIIEDIDRDEAKQHWWESLQEHTQTCISYDLKSIGLLFFDKARYHNSYWINLRK